MSKEFAWTKHKSDDIWRGGPCDSVKECVEEARAEGYSDEELFAIGYIERYEPTYVNSDVIIEYLQQDACDNVGEVAEDWLDYITHEQRAELESRFLKAVQEWLEYCGEKPTFYKVLPFDELTLREAMEKYGGGDATEGKVKAIQPEIVVKGTLEKPFYTILYYDISDKAWHYGFGSYNLAYVKTWLEEEFEVVAETADVKYGGDE